MRSARRLAAIAVACGLAAATAGTAGRAQAAAPVGLLPAHTARALTTELGLVRAWPLRAWMPQALGLSSTPVSVALLVIVRDAVAGVVDQSASMLNLAAAIPDLSILNASPVPGVESSGFGWRRDPFHHRAKFHKGTDFRADRGTPVFAAGAGVVAFTGRQHGYGNVIYLDHGGGVVTRYAHLSKIDVRQGAAIAAATKIGRVGATGRATGPHLHFEIRLDGRAVDPEAAMHVAQLQRTDPAAARVAAWALMPDVQERRTDRHDPPRHDPPRHAPPRGSRTRPERRHAPARDRNRV